MKSQIDQQQRRQQTAIIDPQEVIDTSCDLVLNEAMTLLRKLFSEIEPSFMAASDSPSYGADKLSIRSAFMEALSKLEEAKPSFFAQFEQLIASDFRAFLSRDTANGEGAPSNPITTDIKSLEARKIAFETRNRFFKQLYELRRRMSLIGSGRKIEENELPGGPTHLTACFEATVNTLGIDRRAEVKLYELFEQQFLNQMEPIYDSYNEMLKGLGLFPHLKPVTSTPDTSGQEEELPEEIEDETLFEITEPAEPVPSTVEAEEIPSADEVEEPSIPHQVEPDLNKDLATPSDLIAVLDKIQPLTSTSLEIMHLNPEDAAAPDLHQALSKELHQTLVGEQQQLLKAISRQRLSKEHLNTIKLMGMIFDQLIENPLLPDAAKSLICSLHAPYLKVAIIDTDFLTNRSHPARQLLNLMVRAGGNWVDEGNLQHGIYSQLSETADHILFELKDDTQIFDQLLENLQQGISIQSQKTSVVEHRSQESSRGHDKLLNAHDTVDQAIRERTQGKTLPSPITQFLKGAWNDKLTLILLRTPDAADSPEWQQALEVTEKLVALPPLAPGDQEPALAAELQELREALAEKLNVLGDYHSESAHGLLGYLAGKQSEDSGEGEQEEAAQQVIEAQPLSPKEQLVLDKLLQVEIGTWFKLKLDPGYKKQRAKLSWRSPLTSQHMFVDQAGAQVATLSAHTLARDLFNEDALILGNHKIPFVDRAIRTISQNLRK